MTENDYFKIIEDAIKKIESINFDNSWSYEQILHAIIKIPYFPLIRYKEPKGNRIFRSRINKGEKLYELVSKISLPKEKHVTNYARANKPRQPLFYGSENRPTSYLEFALDLADKTPFGENVLITVGAWELTRDLELGLVFDPSSPRENEYNIYHGKGYDAFIDQAPKELIKGSQLFFEFIAKKFSEPVVEDHQTYLITCAYSNIVFAYGQCDGIIYPSVTGGGDAFNVALKKDVIKNGGLELKRVHVDEFIARKQSNGKHEFINTASMDAMEIENGIIKWGTTWQKHF